MQFINVLETENVVYGIPDWQNQRSFNKYPANIREEIAENFEESVLRDWDSLSKNTAGCFLHFKTDSNMVWIKAEIKRKWEYLKINLCCSSGFDVYEYDGKTYYHKVTLVPKAGENKLEGKFVHNPFYEVCIFLPCYNEIISLELGIVSGEIAPTQTIQELPLAIYGNSITQGASASRSGNAFCNIIARKLNKEIYNYSVSGCCNGLCSIGQMIGSLQVDAIIIDYSRNASNVRELSCSYEKFYRTIREQQADTPIILLTVANFKNHIKYNGFDEIIYETYEKALLDGHKVELINQRKLFAESEYDLISIDGAHYTDIGMLRVANEICSKLKNMRRG